VALSRHRQTLEEAFLAILADADEASAESDDAFAASANGVYASDQTSAPST
jgi:hypothetical protein